MNGATIVLRKVSVVSYFFFLRKEKMHTQILLCLLFSALCLKMGCVGGGSLLLVKALLEIMS